MNVIIPEDMYTKNGVKYVTMVRNLLIGFVNKIPNIDTLVESKKCKIQQWQEILVSFQNYIRSITNIVMPKRNLFLSSFIFVIKKE